MEAMATATSPPMLVSELKIAFHRPGWVYEEKDEGYRILAVNADDRVTLWGRNGSNLTKGFQTIAQGDRHLCSCPSLRCKRSMTIPDGTSPGIPGDSIS